MKISSGYQQGCPLMSAKDGPTFQLQFIWHPQTTQLVWIAELQQNINPISLEIVSPNYPLNTESSHIKCNFVVKTLYGAKITLTPVDVSLDGGCFDNVLTIFDDSVYPQNSSLEYPGLSASCGQSSIPPSTHPVVTKSGVSLQFLRTSDSGILSQCWYGTE